MMSEQLYCDWLKPRLKQVIDAARAINPDIIVFYHSCGFVLPLKNSQAFADAISSLLGGGRKEINQYRENAVLYAREKYRAALAESGYDRIFIDQD